MSKREEDGLIINLSNVKDMDWMYQKNMIMVMTYGLEWMAKKENGLSLFMVYVLQVRLVKEVIKRF